MSEEFLQKIRARGCRLTPQRRAIIEVLSSAPAPPTAGEIWHWVQQRFPEISLDTVYRNLNLLVELGLANQINLRARESSRFEVGKQHHHHLVCLGCGQAVCLEACVLNNEVTEARKNGFSVVGHAFEIYGYCKLCQGSQILVEEQQRNEA